MLASLQTLNDSYHQTTQLLATDNQNLVQQTTQSMVQSLDQILAQHRQYAEEVGIKNNVSYALLDQITSKMSGVIAEMKSIVESQQAIQQTEAQLQTGFAQTMELVDKQCRGFDGLNDLLVAYKSSVESLVKIESTLDKVAEKTQSMAGDYISVNRQMQESTAHLRAQMNATVREVDLQLANIVKLLNSTVQSWNATQSANARMMIDAIKGQ